MQVTHFTGLEHAVLGIVRPWMQVRILNDMGTFTVQHLAPPHTGVGIRIHSSPQPTEPVARHHGVVVQKDGPGIRRGFRPVHKPIACRRCTYIDRQGDDLQTFSEVTLPLRQHTCGIIRTPIVQNNHLRILQPALGQCRERLIQLSAFIERIQKDIRWAIKGAHRPVHSGQDIVNPQQKRHVPRSDRQSLTPEPHGLIAVAEPILTLPQTDEDTRQW